MLTPEELDKLHTCLLNLLKAVDKICRDHNLTYYISDGTMLGAVRHKGFIPWDDDADIFMPRPDYNKFIAHAQEWLPSYYGLADWTVDVNFPYFFARVYDKRTTYLLKRNFDFLSGVPIDIFPLDGISNDCMKRKFHIFRYKLNIKKLYFSNVQYNGLRKYLLTNGLFKLLSRKIIHRRIDKLVQKYDYETSPLICNYFACRKSAYVRCFYPHNWFGEPIQVQFEDATLMGIPGYDQYLTLTYHDYMKIPEPKDRRQAHYKILDLDKSYLEVK